MMIAKCKVGKNFIIHALELTHWEPVAPQPRGWPWHSSKQIFRYAAQSGPINSGADGVTCWVPAIGGIGGGTLRFTHTPKLFWHEAAHPVWTIFIFGMGVTLPAKLVAIEENRIIAATLSFICSPKG